MTKNNETKFNIKNTVYKLVDLFKKIYHKFRDFMSKTIKIHSLAIKNLITIHLITIIKV